ncbi:SDR family oxidoreductase [Mesorhizobium sp. M0976]|uniref:SDR family oxidoreductase n=1 Tax=Mesorhizobium sp. M0976 TaxID=2957038 RepID=UPI003337A348
MRLVNPLARRAKRARLSRCPNATPQRAARRAGWALPLALDVTNRGQITDVAAKAHAHFGRLDIVMNNAGYRRQRTDHTSGAGQV